VACEHKANGGTTIINNFQSCKIENVVSIKSDNIIFKHAGLRCFLFNQLSKIGGHDIQTKVNDLTSVKAGCQGIMDKPEIVSRRLKPTQVSLVVCCKNKLAEFMPQDFKWMNSKSLTEQSMKKMEYQVVDRMLD